MQLLRTFIAPKNFQCYYFKLTLFRLSPNQNKNQKLMVLAVNYKISLKAFIC